MQLNSKTLKMYEGEENADYLGGVGGVGDEEESEEIPNEIWQEACWIVISAYFEEKGQTKITICIFWKKYFFSNIGFRCSDFGFNF